MTVGGMKLIRIALFECYKEKDQNAVADLIGNKVFNLENPKNEHLQLISILTRNIKRRIISLESQDTARKLTTAPAIARFDDLEKRGAPSKAIVLPLIDTEQKEQLNNALESTSDDDFRKICGGLSTKFVNTTKYPKGIIGFVQFNLQISKKNIRKFLTILITDFSIDTLSIDTTRILKYLDKTFNHYFRTTMIYPYLTEKKLTTWKEGAKPQIVLDVDENRIKIHTTTEDSAVFTVVGASQPKNPQKEVERVYREKSLDIKKIKDIKKFVSERDAKSSIIKIKINKESTLNLNLDTFIKNYELFLSNKGPGILIKGGEIEVYLGKINLLEAQKIEFKSVEELFKDDNKE